MFIKVMETRLGNKSDNFEFLTSFLTFLTSVSKPDQQKRKQILLCFFTVVYKPILRHSLFTPTENILSFHFLDVFREYRKLFSQNIFGGWFWTLSHIYDYTFFAQIINYLSGNYFQEGSEYGYFFTAYVRKKWVFNEFSVLLTEVSSIQFRKIQELTTLR